MSALASQQVLDPVVCVAELVDELASRGWSEAEIRDALDLGVRFASCPLDDLGDDEERR
jgi:hypothetical protein